MNKSELVKNLEKRLPDLYEIAGKDGSHTDQHARNVEKWGKIISVGEAVDLELFRIAAFLHDIGYRGNLKKIDNHAEESARIIEGKLPEVKAALNFTEYQALLSAIRNHSLPPQPNNPILDKVLRDGDRLDGLGESGIRRLKRVLEFYQIPVRHPTREALEELLTRGIVTKTKTSGDYGIRLLGYSHFMETKKGKGLARKLVVITRKKILEYFPDLKEFMKEFQQKWS